MFTYRLMYYLLLLFAVSACSKSESGKCPSPSNTTVYSNRSVIYEAATLSLSAGASAGNTYSWTGPGGWTSNQSIPVITNMQPQNAGTYSVQVYDLKNCLVFSGSKNISVIPPPAPPCAVTTGTVTTTLPGLGFSFPGGVSTYAYQGAYYYSGVAANGDRIDIQFSGTLPPFAGVYKTTNLAAMTEDNVIITVTNGPIKYYSKAGDDVYVNNAAGKMVVTFCNTTMQFVSFPTTTEFTMTGKLSPF